MKAAIYGRVMEDDQQENVQIFFDELGRQKITPLIFENFFEEIKEKIQFPSDTASFFLVRAFDRRSRIYDQSWW